MKGKIPSILAILFALSLVLGLAASIAPASIVAAETTDKWEGVTMPSTISNTLFPGSNVGPLAVSNGTIYAAVNVPAATNPWAIYTSTDGGYKWTKGDKITATKDAGAIIAVVLSLDQKTLYVATINNVYTSVDGGKTLEKIDLDTTLPLGVISSMDVTADSSGRQIVVIGSANGVFTYNENGFLSWKAKMTAATAVLAVKASSNYATDKVIIAFTAAGVVTTYKGGDWNDKIGNCAVGAATTAKIVLPSDFNIDSVPYCYVGLSGATNDVWKVELVKTPVAATHLIPSTTAAVAVSSLVIVGPDASAKLYVGGSDPFCATQAQVYTGANLGTFPGWQPSWMAPSGQTPVLAYDGTNLYCGTVDGITQSAFSHATDGAKGMTWQARGLIDQEVTSATADVTSFSASTAFATDKTMFMVVTDGAIISVWRTTTGGQTWEKVISVGTTTPKGDALTGAIVYASPDFSTTKTAYILNAAAANYIWSTTDGGNTWQKIHSPLTLTAPGTAVTAFYVVSSTTVLIGDNGGNMYKTEDGGKTWKDVIAVPGTPCITDISVASDGSVAVSGYIGTVSSVWLCQDAKTFVQVGPEAANSGIATPNSYVAFDINYKDNQRIYIAVSGDGTADLPGFYRTVVDKTNPTSSAWECLRVVAGDIRFTGFEVNQDGALYAPVYDPTAIDGGVARILDGTIKDLTKLRYDLIDDGLMVDTGMNQLQAVKGSTILFSIAKNSNGIDKLSKYTDTLTSAATGMTPATGAKSQGVIVGAGEIVSVTVQLSVSGLVADGYDWQVSQNPAMSGAVTQVTDKASFTATGLGLDATYYWRVRANAPALGPWSAISSFTTLAGDDNMASNVPVLGDVIVAESAPIFTWSKVLKATNYKIQISSDYSFASPTEKTVTDTAYRADKLDKGTYFWRVKAVTADGDSAWSAAGSFAIGTSASDDTGSSTPAWVWVLIVLGVILAIFVLVLILRTRRPV